MTSAPRRLCLPLRPLSLSLSLWSSGPGTQTPELSRSVIEKLFVEPDLAAGTELPLNKDQSLYLAAVLRKSVGDEVVLFEITNHGMRDISQFTLRGGGKREAKPTKVRDAFLKQAAEKSALVLGDELPIVICGPGMTRDQFARLLREAGCAQRTLNVATSIGGRSAANEVLAKQLADEFLGESAIAKQVSVIEEALARIATNGAVAYGPDQLTAAQEQGAIETLVIVADLLRDSEANIAGTSWSIFAAEVTEGSGEMVQASTDHDSGKQLDGMGGALALLRWKIDG